MWYYWYLSIYLSISISISVLFLSLSVSLSLSLSPYMFTYACLYAFSYRDIKIIPASLKIPVPHSRSFHSCRTYLNWGEHLPLPHDFGCFQGASQHVQIRPPGSVALPDGLPNATWLQEFERYLLVVWSVWVILERFLCNLKRQRVQLQVLIHGHCGHYLSS